tara:strand:+ start:1622 stop:2668 length:1047 start_codon:yes stop_codon:yes gene_type:complete
MAQIDKPNLHFNTVLYTGNASTRSITGVGFQPDWCWFKSRGDTNGHMLYDAVRGATKVITSNSANVEATETNGLTSFNSDGFSIGSAAGENANSQPIVAWNWKANGQGSANTDGTINSTATSANTTSGFSIVKYTGNGSNGATVGHGLGAVPEMIIIKEITGSGRNWRVYHKKLGNNYVMYLNTDSDRVSDATAFNSTSPTSSVFSLGTSGGTNDNGNNYIAYCFTPKNGYSKFGEYIGNGSGDGPFIYTGFKPAFVLTKQFADQNDGWSLTDSARDRAVAPNGARLLAQSTQVEQTNESWALIEKFSNGFKIRGTDNVTNASGKNYLYMAFAENPVVGSNNIPAVGL